MKNSYEKYLYIRTEADEDDDDDAARSIALPASRIVAIAPSSDSALTIWFESVNNMFTSGDDELVLKDSIVLNVTTHRHKEVAARIIQAINGGPHDDGWIVVADDTTTDFDASTRDAVYIHPNITSVGAITIAGANS
tara:strand:+ start:83 stop:493 length:411 start_codon:yes stop_codon:yes gene_type:complete